MKYSKEEMERYRELYNRGVSIFKENRAKSVSQISNYSHAINTFIRNEKELKVYIGLHLTETFITRPALIIRIDPYCCDSLGVSNLTKMLSGKAPIDATTGETIDLHHIGQRYDSPFAELPHMIHNSDGNYSILHTSTVSWRNDKDLLHKTNVEISKYWKLRGAMYL